MEASESFQLVHEGSGCMGVALCRLDGQAAAAALITVQGDGVMCCDVSSQRRLRSWALGARWRFAASAVWDAASDRCFAAVEPATGGESSRPQLVPWAAAIGSGGVLPDPPLGAHLRGPVLSLHAPPVGGGAGVVVIYRDGSVGVHGPDGRERGHAAAVPPAIVDSAVAVASAAWPLGGGGDNTCLVGVCIVHRSTRGAAPAPPPVVMMYAVGEMVTARAAIPLTPPGDASATGTTPRLLAAAAGCPDPSSASPPTPTLALMWSPATLQLLTFKGEGTTPNVTWSLVGSTTRAILALAPPMGDPPISGADTTAASAKKRRAPAAPTPSFLDCGVHLVALPGGYLAACVPHSPRMVVILDSRYGATHGHHDVPLTSTGGLTALAAHAGEGAPVLAVAWSTGVAAVAPRLPPLTTAAILATRPVHPPASRVMTIPRWCAPGADAHVCAAVRVDPTTIWEGTTGMEDDAAAGVALASLRGSLSDAAAAGVLRSLMTSSPRVACWAAAASCVCCTRGWWTALQTMLDTQTHGVASAAAAAACAAGVITTLVKGANYDVLESLLPKCRDLPTADLLCLLKAGTSMGVETDDVTMALRAAVARRTAVAAAAVHDAESAAMAMASHQGGGGEDRMAALAATAAHLRAVATSAVAAATQFTPREMVLHATISAPRDAVAAGEALRLLTGVEVAALLRYLGRWADCHARGDTTPGSGLPTPLAVVEWSSWAVDAHLGRLALAPAAAGALSVLARAVGTQLAASTAVAALAGAVEHLRRRAPLPTGATAADYSVELFNL